MHRDHTETDKNSPGENRDHKRDDGDSPRVRSSPKPEIDTTRRVLKTTTTLTTRCQARRSSVPSINVELTECKAFDRKPLKEKMEWIKKARLCFRCLSGKDRAKERETDVKCSEYGSNHHLALLHLEKEKMETKDHVKEIRSTCTAVCYDREGGLLCSKIVLMDVFPEKRPDQVHPLHAIVDDQSNAFMISPDLVDKLGETGSKEKYSNA